jgi:hypothetical protein
MLGVMNLFFFGETHEEHSKECVPSGDTLVGALNFTMCSRRLAAIADPGDWFEELPHRFKLVVPVSHKFLIEADYSRCALLSNATVQIDESVEIEGLLMYGSPMTHLHGAPFRKSLSLDHGRHRMSGSENISARVTHGTPFGNPHTVSDQSTMVGRTNLRQPIKEFSRLQVHAFGHLYGVQDVMIQDDATFIDAFLMESSDGEMPSPPVARRLYGTN